MTEFNKYDFSNPFEVLEGKKILGIFGNKSEIAVETDQGSFTFKAYGDCCSSSWFEHVSGVDNIFGHNVISTREDSLPSSWDQSEYELIQSYGWTISTDKGYFQVEMRNLFNGYYGGSIELTKGKDESLKPLKDF